MAKFDNKQYKQTYHVWYSMVWRCNRKDGYYYKYYGSRGIMVCPRWKIFNNFLADMGLKPDSMTLERINNTLGYSPSNCKWASQQDQCNNRSNNRIIKVDNETLTVSQWWRKLGINRNTLKYWALKGDDYFSKRVKSL